MADRKKIMLACLLIFFAVSLVYRLTHPFKQEKVSSLTYTGDNTSRHMVTVKIQAISENDNDAINFHEALDRFLTPESFSGAVIENPFFKMKEPPKPREETVIPKIAYEEQKEAEDPLVAVNRELGRFKVLGSYESDGEKAIFLGREKEMLVVRIGDRIDGKYLVQDITDESVILKAEFINETVHIDMSEF